MSTGAEKSRQENTSNSAISGNLGGSTNVVTTPAPSAGGVTEMPKSPPGAVPSKNERP